MAIEGKLESAVQLDDLTVQSIKKRFEALTGEEIRFKTQINPELLGGFIVTINNRVYDNSIKTSLGRLKEFITEEDEVLFRELTGKKPEIKLDFDYAAFKQAAEEKIKEYVKPAGSDVGTVTYAGDGIVHVEGLEGCKYGELLQFENNSYGIVMNLSKESIGAVLLNNADEVSTGSTARNTGSVVQVPVGTQLLGRVINPLGIPIDGKGRIAAVKHRAIESPAPAIMDRQGVRQPLETGIMCIDSMIPIGKGQRELIIGDRQTGKTAIALSSVLNQ